MVAIKTIRKQGSEAEQEKQLNQFEMDVVGKLNNPRLLKIIEMLQDYHNFYVVMELIDGGNLLQKFESMGSFREDKIAMVVQQILQALKTLH